MRNKSPSREGTGIPADPLAGAPGWKITADRSLARRFPAIAREWHPTLNPFTPDRVGAGSRRLVWWKCPRGEDHVWQVTPERRTARGYGCPFCSGLRVSRGGSLAGRFPELARDWHPLKNATLQADQVMPGTRRQVWWRCQVNEAHEWRTRVCNRTSPSIKSGCPLCAHFRTPPDRLLVNAAPEIAAEFHAIRNPKVDISRLSADSFRMVWWCCRKGHVWRATVFQRMLNEEGCPDCEGG